MNISVIIPVYNTERFLQDCISSVMNQDGVYEIILVDDGSTDGSRQLCEQWAKESSQIKILTHEGRVHLGRSATRNLGINHAACEWVSFLDSDDYFLPGRFMTLTKAKELRAQGYYMSVGTSYEDENYKDVFEDRITQIEHPPPSRDLLDFLIQNDDERISLIGLTVRKSAVRALGGFDTKLEIGEDTDLIWRLAGQFAMEPQPGPQSLSVRRVHGSNTYFNKELVRRGRHLFYRKWLTVANKYSLAKASKKVIFRKALSYSPAKPFKFKLLDYFVKGGLLIYYYSFISFQKLRTNGRHREPLGRE